MFNACRRRIWRTGALLKLVMTQSNLTLRGGGERVLLKIAQHYDAKIYTAEYDKGSTFEEFADLDVSVIGKGGLRGMMPYGRVAQGITYGMAFYGMRVREDYDVINAHMAPSHWIRHLNDRVLWYCHTPLRDVWDLYWYRLSLKKPLQKPVYMVGAKAVRAIDRRVVRDIEFIFANSHNTRSRLVKYFGRDDAKVLKGGIDSGRYENRGDGRYFLYPSRISPNKRQTLAIEAFVRFKRLMGRKADGYRLIMAGSISKDKAFQDYYAQVADMARKVSGVSVLTNIDDKRLLDLYSRSTAVLYPPMDEDYGLVPLEAMASGKVVIASNEGGPRETVSDGSTGFLVNGPQGMAERMRDVVLEPARAKDMGRRGVRNVRSNYSWENFFQTFDKGLRRVKKGGT